MFSRRIRQRARQRLAFLIQSLARVGVTPNMLTMIGLLLSGITAFGLIAQRRMLVGGLLILFAGMFDMFDGAMARVQNAATSFGAFVDSMLVRDSESIIPGLLARPERVVILAIGLLSHTGI